jgi:multisubunit Na+/H+ antiporter MnhG subunit
MNGEPVSAVLVSFLVLLGWSIALFAIGVMRFNQRYL